MQVFEQQPNSFRHDGPPTVLRLDEISQLAQIDCPVVLAIGMFDGLHLGHQEVFRQASAAAARHNARLVVVTFEPHPATVVARATQPRILMHLPYKERLLRRLGVDCLLVIRFDDRFAAQEPSGFVEQLITHADGLRAIVVGRDWAFGRRRSGDVALLERIGREAGYEVIGVGAVERDGGKISSTRIREALREGDLDQCRRLLGRRFSLLGKVVTGQRLGRELGFPTANLDVHGDLVPPAGVYAVHARELAVASGDDDHFTAPADQPCWCPAVANIGVRPTLEQDNPETSVEVHLLDAPSDTDLYGKDLEVEFITRLRGEEKFDGLDALKTQIALDVAGARELLERDGEGS